jgi:hypothetical protein
MSAADAGGTHGKPHTRMTVAGSASRGGSAIAGRTSFAHDSLLEGDGFEPSVPREGVKGPSPQFHADYPPIGWAHKQRMKRMLNGFKRDGITCPAQTGCQPDRLS